MTAPVVPALRRYQQQCVAKLRASYASGHHRAPVLVLPTGGGKTIVFAEVTRGARAKGKRVLVVVHRRELLKQASAKLAWAGTARENTHSRTGCSDRRPRRLQH